MRFARFLGISKSRTTPYQPQSDGLVERFNKTLQHMLATTVRDHPFDWEELLPMVCMAYNTSTHSTTGYTPFYLMFGREARLPVDIAYGTREPDLATPPSYASDLQKSLREAYHRVRTSFDTGHQHRKEIYDKKVHGRQYESDELVWLHSPAIPRGQSKKLHHAWTGPYRVLQRLSDCDYRIQVALGQKKPPIVVHFNRLKLCLPGTRFPSHKTPTERKNAPVPSHRSSKSHLEPTWISSTPMERWARMVGNLTHDTHSGTASPRTVLAILSHIRMRDVFFGGGSCVTELEPSGTLCIMT